MALLRRDDILGASDITTERVAVPEWGGDVLVAVMAGTDREEFGTWVQRSGETPEFVARLCALTLVGEDSTRLFSEENIAALGQKSGLALQRVFSVAMRLNKLRAEDVETEKGNFGAGQSAGGSSA